MAVWVIDQEQYVQKWIEEVPLSKERAKQVKSPLTPKEISSLRGALGTLAWKSAQTGPQFQAETSLLLSEVTMANVGTLLKLNKLVREVRRVASQSLLFPAWGRHWRDLIAVSWCDAGQQNRPDRSSTLGPLGILTGLAPKELLEGAECLVSVINWRSGRTPRQCLGSNGAEVQAVTEAEDVTFKVRAMWSDMHGEKLTKQNLYEKVRQGIGGALVVDTRQIIQVMTKFRWVNGLAQLADCLTKAGERRVFLQFMARGQSWRIIHDEQFTAGRKLKKRQLEQAAKEAESLFIEQLKEAGIGTAVAMGHG